MKPWCFRHIYQDMTNYLFNTKISGDNNPEAYNRVLRIGCRAVEIDCYDGNNGRPFVKSCLFESIIHFIEANLFKTLPYPVILDIENHYSIEQQYEITRILRKILGDEISIN